MTTAATRGRRPRTARTTPAGTEPGRTTPSRTGVSRPTDSTAHPSTDRPSTDRPSTDRPSTDPIAERRTAPHRSDQPHGSDSTGRVSTAPVSTAGVSTGPDSRTRVSSTVNGGSFSQPYGQSYSGNPYGGAQQYGQTPAFGSSPYGGQSSPSYYPATATQPKRGGSRAGLVAGVIVLTALAGGIGGVVGAGLEDSSSRSLSSPLGGDRETSQPVQGAQGVRPGGRREGPPVGGVDRRARRQPRGRGVRCRPQPGRFHPTNNHVVTAESGRSGQLTVSYNDGSTSGASVVGADPISTSPSSRPTRPDSPRSRSGRRATSRSDRT